MRTPFLPFLLSFCPGSHSEQAALPPPPRSSLRVSSRRFCVYQQRGRVVGRARGGPRHYALGAEDEGEAGSIRGTRGCHACLPSSGGLPHSPSRARSAVPRARFRFEGVCRLICSLRPTAVGFFTPFSALCVRDPKRPREWAAKTVTAVLPAFPSHTLFPPPPNSHRSDAIEAAGAAADEASSEARLSAHEKQELKKEEGAVSKGGGAAGAGSSSRRRPWF